MERRSRLGALLAAPVLFGRTNGSLLLYFGTICTSRPVPFSIARHFVTANPVAQTSLLYSRLLFHALLDRATMPHILIHSYSLRKWACSQCVRTSFQMLPVLSVRCMWLLLTEISNGQQSYAQLDTSNSVALDVLTECM